MGFMDRLGKVVRAELTAITRPADRRPPSSAPPTTTGVPQEGRAPLVTDVDGALRVLELMQEPTLDLVRARAHELARHYHPKTTSTDPEEARAARLVLRAITEAQELLEEHLLPLPPAPPSTPPTAATR
jgi:hypothetical protein